MEVGFFCFHIPDSCGVFVFHAEVWSLLPLANEMECPARSVPPTLTRLIPSDPAGERLGGGLGVQGYLSLIFRSGPPGAHLRSGA